MGGPAQTAGAGTEYTGFFYPKGGDASIAKPSSTVDEVTLTMLAVLTL